MNVLSALSTARVLAVLRRAGTAAAIADLADDLRARGVRAIECTLDQPDAFDAVAALLEGRRPGEVLGGGTVTTTGQIDALVAAGADFAVSPHLDEGLLAHALDRGFCLIPGVMTPSEIARATALGAPAVKLFPAGPLGVRYLSALRGPFPDVAVVPTGGIAVEDVPAWLHAGALCVGLGAALTSGDTLPDALAGIVGGGTR